MQIGFDTLSLGLGDFGFGFKGFQGFSTLGLQGRLKGQKR